MNRDTKDLMNMIVCGVMGAAVGYFLTRKFAGSLVGLIVGIIFWSLVDIDSWQVWKR